MMADTLWRGGEHLGDIVFPLPTSGHHQSIAGVFAPSPAFHDLAPGMQVHPPFLPGRPDFEASFTDTHTHGPIALSAISEDEAKGIPAHRVFVLRDADGAPLQMRSIGHRRRRAEHPIFSPTHARPPTCRIPVGTSTPLPGPITKRVISRDDG